MRDSRTRRMCRRRKEGGDLAAHHQADQFGLVDLVAAQIPNADSLSIAEDCDTVCDPKHLFQAMRDIDNPDAPRAETSNQFQQ